MYREGPLGAVLSGAGAGGRDEGFSLLELIIVLTLASVVLVIASGALISLDNATSRNDSIVQEEQSASTTMARMERDIRSASSISIPTGASPADQLEVAVLGSDGSITNILWRYDPAALTLTRETQQEGTFQPSGYAITHVANGTGSPVFRYYDSGASEISGTTASNIANCATAVDIDFTVSSATSGVGSFEESAAVALTNQVQALTTPGNGQCGSA